MKLMSLDLRAVGPFSGVVLDLSAGEEGLHLIYGPNEAGKTSALRAVSHLLFGFPHLSADNFVHHNEQLRVGGKLRHSDGQELEILRRRGRGKTLRGPDDSSVVADEHGRRFLGGMSQDTFETLFGIDHERLKQAGEEIRKGQGQFGELLFAAGAGLAGLRRAQQSLNKTLDDLFRPKAPNSRINKALTEIEGAQKELKRQQLTIEDWQHHEGAYQEALADSERLREQIRATRVEHARLKRIKSAILIVANHRRLTRELQELGQFVRLRDDFGGEFRNAQDKQRLAEHSVSKARAAIEEITASLAPLDPSRVLLDSVEEIEALQERLGAVEKANHDRMNVESLQKENEHQARRLLRELGRSTDLELAEQLRLRADEPAIIRGLGQKFAELRGQAEEARRTVARHEDQIRRREKELADLEKPHDVEALRRCVRQARKAGDIKSRLTEARDKLGRAEKQGELALAKLTGWTGSADDLRRLIVPLSATLDQFESHFLESARQRQALVERVTKEKESIRDRQSSLHSLALQQDVPTEESVLAARGRRDEGWRLVQAAWLEGAPDGEDRALFIAEFAPADTLAEAYEQSVKRADMLADRLRREADRVARNAELVAALDRHRATCVALEHDIKLIDDRQTGLSRDWKELVTPLYINALAWSPAELRAWLRGREEVVQLLEKAEEIGQDVKPLEQAVATHHAALDRELAPFCNLRVTKGLDLAESLEQAEAFIKQQDEIVQKRDQLATKLAAARAEQASARQSLQAAEAELEEWQSDWSVKMSRIGLEASAAPAQAEFTLTRIAELFKELDDRREFQKRIRGIDRDAELFKQDVAALTARVAADLAFHSAAEQARELASRLRNAQADARQSVALTQQREREQANVRSGEAQHDEARVNLKRLCQEANCTEIDQLAEAERRSQTGARLERELSAVREQLMITTAGDDLAGFTAEVERTDPDALEASIKELESRIAALEEEQRGVQEKVGAAREAVSRMNGGADAAERAESVQALLARLQGDVARFATLKLAATVLHRGIERYREQNQGPILARASGLFAALTNGSFTRLQIDDDGNGRSVVKGIRPDGQLVGVEGMSDGSHDQLYLALRLASLESWLFSHEPVPFIVDDILLNFDDQRAVAALGALTELSRKTQVLFFTHHLHLIELARLQLPRDLVFFHELPRSFAKPAMEDKRR